VPGTAAVRDVYRAVADPTRRGILDLLLTGPAGFQDVHSRFPLTKGAVSQHLKILVEAGLVEVDPGDRSRRYRLTPAPLHEIDQWLTAYREFWASRLDALDRVVRARSAPRPTRHPTGRPDDPPDDRTTDQPDDQPDDQETS
jgi:DNA-binding transcriptional ArsR family regulator